jgi:hypothetical protein
VDLQALALAQPPRGNVRQTFTALNGLRILAALLVLFFHYGALTDSFVDFPIVVRNFIHNGTIALPFFYVLSGFVLTYAYSGLSYATLQTREFYSARIARLFPANPGSSPRYAFVHALAGYGLIDGCSRKQRDRSTAMARLHNVPSCVLDAHLPG